MKCPICFEGIHENWKVFSNIQPISEKRQYNFEHMECPECGNTLVRYTSWNAGSNTNSKEGLMIPLTQKRKPLPEFIPKKYVELYEESNAVLDISPRASAALSRTCLQMLLRDYGKVNPGKLFDEIQQVLDSKTLPVETEKTIDIIRENGNNATHPNKSENPGEIISVESDEAEWGLEILDSLFEHYIIRPYIQNEKLKKFKEKHKK